jgi:hypothetical protein
VTRLQIEDFLAIHVEGYLFGDLESMSRVVAPGQRFGAVVYPMLAASLAGIELLGSLVTPTGPFNRHGGQDAFVLFWEQYLYPSGSPAPSLARTVYALTRHGLAHVFLAKPGIVATKDGNPARHLRRESDGSLLIDAIVLSDDLRSAYAQRLKPLLSAATSVGGPSRATMQARLDEMIHTYRSQSIQHAAAVLLTAPAAPLALNVTQVNSPTASSTISASNLTRSPFVPTGSLDPDTHDPSD